MDVLIKYANAKTCETNFIFSLYSTMHKVQYTMDQQIQAVQEVVDAFGKKITVTEENMMWAFGNVFNSMMEDLGFDKTKKGEIITNDRFAQFIHFEFLPQYAQIL